MDMSPTPVDSLARYVREITHDGKDLVEFARCLARGEPIRQLKKTKDGRVVEGQYLPTLRDRKWASEMLAKLASRGCRAARIYLGWEP